MKVPNVFNVLKQHCWNKKKNQTKW